jgi:hypothetical protein
MHRRTLLTIMMVGLLAATSGAMVLRAQESDQADARAQFAGMQRLTGEITAIAGAKITIKAADGVTMEIVTTDNTRVMKGRSGPNGATGGTVKVADLKVGDGLVAMGNLDAPNKTLHAAMLMATDAAQVKAMRENLGKTYIAGRVTAVDLDDAKMTVERPDRVAQTIGFDESTSFKRGGHVTGGSGAFGLGGGAGAPPPTVEGGESITLADIKIGDNVTGTGSVKAGVFVPAQLVVAPSEGGRGRRRGGAGANGPTPQ